MGWFIVLLVGLSTNKLNQKSGGRTALFLLQNNQVVELGFRNLKKGIFER